MWLKCCQIRHFEICSVLWTVHWDYVCGPWTTFSKFSLPLKNLVCLAYHHTRFLVYISIFPLSSHFHPLEHEWLFGLKSSYLPNADTKIFLGVLIPSFSHEQRCWVRAGPADFDSLPWSCWGLSLLLKKSCSHLSNIFQFLNILHIKNYICYNQPYFYWPKTIVLLILQK